MQIKTTEQTMVFTWSRLSSVPGTGNRSLARQVQPGLCLELPTPPRPGMVVYELARALAGTATAKIL